MILKNTGAIVLAAGKGTRLNSTTQNKVMRNIGHKPMIGRTVEILKKVGLKPIIIVVGFGKELIKKYLGGSVKYAVQEKQLGTAHAASCGLKALPKEINNVLVVYGDDSYCYPVNLLAKLVNLHSRENADITILTIEKDNPFGLGRILRDKNDSVVGIVEERNADKKQKEITEINTGCYVFNAKFLNDYLSKIKKNKLSGEYYLTDLVELAVKNKKKLEAVRGNKIPWRGVNTPSELKEARNIIAKLSTR